MKYVSYWLREISEFGHPSGVDWYRTPTQCKRGNPLRNQVRMILDLQMLFVRANAAYENGLVIVSDSRSMTSGHVYWSSKSFSHLLKTANGKQTSLLLLELRNIYLHLIDAHTRTLLFQDFTLQPAKRTRVDHASSIAWFST